MATYRNVSVLLGRTLTGIENRNNEELVFAVDDGTTYRMFHSQDCCEIVRVQDINGSLDDLVGSPLTMAEEATSKIDPEGYKPDGEWRDSYTWTFYKFATLKGYVTIRWLGESNGYYSESVDFVEA